MPRLIWEPKGMIDLSRDYSDDELLAMPPHEYQHNCFRAPPPLWEAVLTEDPRALELHSRWSKLHYPDKYDRQAESDPFDALRGALDSQRLWHEARDLEGNLTAVHPLGVDPNDPVAVAEWEKGCRELHDRQNAILPEAKPEPISLTRGHIVRGD